VIPIGLGTAFIVLGMVFDRKHGSPGKIQSLGFRVGEASQSPGGEILVYELLNTRNFMPIWLLYYLVSYFSQHLEKRCTIEMNF
jgi:hypothetical protein